MPFCWRCFRTCGAGGNLWAGAGSGSGGGAGGGAVEYPAAGKHQMIGEELHSLVTASSGSLSISAGVALVLALWSASRGMSGLVNALNIAYDEKESRGFFKLNLVAIVLTVLMLIGGTVVIALVGVLPAALQLVGLEGSTKWLLLLLEWPLLIAVVMFGLAMLYRYAPDRHPPRWRWVSPGAVAATVLWLLGSVAFTVYVSHFNSYDKTYGSLGGVVVMLTWLYLSAFVALFGAVINAQSERQTQETSDGSRSQWASARLLRRTHWSTPPRCPLLLSGAIHPEVEFTHERHQHESFLLAAALIAAAGP